MEQQFELERLSERVDATLAGQDGDDALLFLRQQLQVLKSRIPDNPFGAVRADIYPATYEMVSLALKLADEFQSRGDMVREETALFFRSRAVCYTYGHYRHLVGPAMLELAECRQRMGQNEAAQEVFQAVIKDFAELLDYGGTDDATRTGLESLKKALEESQEPDNELLDRTIKALRACDSEPSVG